MRRHLITKYFLNSFCKVLPKSNRNKLYGKIANRIRVFFARRVFKGISKKATIEKGAVFAGNSNIVIEDYGCVGVNCLISSNVYIGEHTMMGPNVRIYTQNHKFDPIERRFDGYDFKEVKIGKHCWIGDGAIILPGVTIGNGCIIGAGAVVTKSFGDYLLIAGNPAVVKKRLVEND